MPSRNPGVSDPTLRPAAPPLEWTPAGLRREAGAPGVTAATEPVAGLAVDAVVVGMHGDGEAGPRVAVPDALPAGAVAALEAAARSIRFAAKARETVRVPAPEGMPGDVVVLAGLGRSGDGGGAESAALRRVAGAAVRSLAGATGIAEVALVLPAPDAAAVRAVAEGALLGGYSFTWYRTRADAGADDAEAVAEPPAIRRIHLDTTAARGAGSSRPDAEAAVASATVAAESAWLARDLVNLSPVDLSPPTFAEAARTVGAGAGFDVAVLDEQALVEGGYGGLLAVGAGSSRPPRLVVCEYRPRRARAHLALVGKGITFDSGGLSLKPPTAMPAMKGDMAGAAAVLAAVAAAARAELPVRVTGYLALAENMPSGTAQRPSDVIRIRGGRTVEVLNTDAEGRLVLADGIVAAFEQQPDAVVDVATLTGAAVVALGPRTTGLFGTDQALVDRISAAGRDAGEASWAMPLAEDLRPGLDSSVADIANISGKRDGGMISAALFLREFVPTDGDGGRRPWAHLDVAGPAFHESGAEDITPKGGTGVPVRTLIRLVESYR
ncbi:MAG: leucyl aminopeptidase [Kineosporiaceae bacterium]